ncbi:uncharacterized protein LOC127572726 isoform X2 [Pristis pectinata]|uniref:uncharacterized protein LOC127572726 isoform X2 n=1 Tax=Pristis pectinata TaxID=685728 RepID=UPI00223E873E|nr:uncharacterized protein LOC127572726 isoform X2 [Pristis pectinata]
MVDRLSREDGGRYRFRVEINVGSFQLHVLTALSVRAPDGNGSVVTGTEGASATLPCMFTRPPHYLNLHRVTWVRKDPYRHIVTFTHHGNGSWAAENRVTWYELVGDPEQGNASTRIKQLSAEDSDGYLCLVEFRKPDDDLYTASGDYYRFKTNSQLIHLSQHEVRLRVRPGTDIFPILMLCIPLGLKTLALLVMFVVYCSDKLGKRRD